MANNRPNQMRRGLQGTAADARTQGSTRYRQRGGNAAMSTDKEKPASAQRKDLFSHIEQRLDVVKTAQERELIEGHRWKNRDHWREIADSHKPGFDKPDTEKWHKAAQLYQSAADALARGDMRRGAGLLRMAEEEEKKAFEQVPDQIDTKDLQRLPAESSPRRGSMGMLGTTTVPEGIRSSVDRILHTDQWLEDLGVKFIDDRSDKRIEDEEADEEGGDKGKGGTGSSSSSAG